MPAKSKPKTKLKAKTKDKKKPVVKKKLTVNEKTPQEALLSVNTVLDSLVEDKNILIPEDVIEPDESLLIQQEEEFDDSLPLRSHEVAAELSEDPVRLYLREIGLVKLLGSDSEFRLATIIEADRLIGTLHKMKQRKGVSLPASIYHSLIADMLVSWDRLVEDCLLYTS